jgi:rhodanese-related sulfurtransferase
MNRPAVDQLLAEVRAALPPRPGPADLEAVRAGGGLVVDTRPAALRAQDGELPGAVVVERNVLEWRLDPTSPHRLDEVGDHDQQIVVVCDEGYASSLAAASLQALGLTRATDLDGGYQAWRRYQATKAAGSTGTAGASPTSVPGR